jgi:hypothetical protein
MRYDLVVENLEAADEILFRLLENSLHIEEKREIMLADFSRIKSRIRKAELFLKYDESKHPQPPDLANTVLGEVCPHCRKLITLRHWRSSRNRITNV